MREANIQRLVMLEAEAAGMTLWRNNVGMGWTGDKKDITRYADGSVMIRNARPLHAGLCNGSSDLIGLKAITVTTDMVGLVIAQFTAVETKQPGKYPSQPQRNFLDFVRQAGGIAIVARSPEDLHR